MTQPRDHRTTIVWHIATTAEGGYGGFPPPPLHTITAVGALLLVDKAKRGHPPKKPAKVGFSLGVVGQPLTGQDGGVITEEFLLDKLLVWFCGADSIVGCRSDTFGLPVIYNRCFALNIAFPWFDSVHGDPGHDVDIAQRFEVRGLSSGGAGFHDLSHRLGLPGHKRQPAPDGRELPTDCLTIALAYLRTEHVEGRLDAAHYTAWLDLLRSYYTPRSAAFSAYF